jgi:hypothetical protein
MGAEIAKTVSATVDELRRFKMSATEYVKALTVPVNPASGVKTSRPVPRSMFHSPFPETVSDVCVQFGAVSLVPQINSVLESSPVPVSFDNGET